MAEFVFLVGTGRCGSTLLSEIVARHEDVGFISNLDERLPRLPLGGQRNGRLYRRFTSPDRARHPKIIPTEGYSLLRREVSPMLDAPCRDLTAADATPWIRARFAQFFEARAAAAGTEVFAHKFTGWPRARFVAEVLPQAKFIHIVRDGRAVANSWLQMPWWGGYEGPDRWRWGPLPDAYLQEWHASGRSFVVLAGLLWKVLIDAHQSAREDLPADRWLDVRYEDLLAAPREVVREVLSFSGIAWTPRFDEQFARYRISAERREAFAGDLSPTDVEMLDRSLSRHLAMYGYLPPTEGGASVSAATGRPQSGS